MHRRDAIPTTTQEPADWVVSWWARVFALADEIEERERADLPTARKVMNEDTHIAARDKAPWD